MQNSTEQLRSGCRHARSPMSLSPVLAGERRPGWGAPKPNGFPLYDRAAAVAPWRVAGRAGRCTQATLSAPWRPHTMPVWEGPTLMTAAAALEPAARWNEPLLLLRRYRLVGYSVIAYACSAAYDLLVTARSRMPHTGSLLASNRYTCQPVPGLNVRVADSSAPGARIMAVRPISTILLWNSPCASPRANEPKPVSILPAGCTS